LLLASRALLPASRSRLLIRIRIQDDHKAVRRRRRRRTR
jgi:hypothetical protein